MFRKWKDGFIIIDNYCNNNFAIVLDRVIMNAAGNRKFYTKLCEIKKIYEIWSEAPHTNLCPYVFCLVRIVKYFCFSYLQIVCVCVCVCSESLYNYEYIISETHHKFREHYRGATKEGGAKLDEGSWKLGERVFGRQLCPTTSLQTTCFDICTNVLYIKKEESPNATK